RLAVGAVDGHGDTDGVVHLYLDRAGTWTFERRVFPRPPQTGERFGAAVALAGDVLAVGAPGYNLPGGAPDAGAVHVFRRENGRWLPQAKLSSPADPYRAGQQLGFAVATDGSQIFAGAPTAEPEGPRLVSSGAVYRFTLRAGAWGPGELLAVSSLAAGDQLGFSLSLSGDLLVAGAPAPPPGRGSGGIRVFRRSGGSWEALAPSPAAPANAERRDLAGFAVAVSGERVAVGAVLGDQADGAAGASWSFHCSEEGDACREESEAVARDPDAGTLFGAAMALTDEHLAVGEPDAGAAYLYRKAGLGWRQEKRLLSGSAADGFGSAVALAGGLLAVGAPRGRAGGVSGEPAGYPGGSVDFYSRDGGSWAYKGLFYPDPPIPERPFGVAAAFEGDRVAIGAPGLDVPSAVFLFEKGDRGWGLAGTFPLAPGGGFGAAVSLRGGNLAIGAPETGAVYVVARGEHGWPQPEPRGLQPIAPRLPGTGLGASVVLGDGVLAAGAPDTEGGSGAVHLYESSKGAWQGGRLSAPPGAASRLGASLALLESRLAVGAPDPEGTGRAFLYDLGRKAWEEEPLLPLAPRVCGGFGDAVALSKDFVVVASPDPSCGDRVTVFALPPEGGEDP
ncbi:MAG TPA: hypothetical protein DD490_01125, partial [Acidobacteria bacterium]|nr:hypothetical protein [Acidobacteriota bacterium]